MGHLSMVTNPLCYEVLKFMHHKRNQNGNYDKPVLKERIKEAAKHALKDSLTPGCPAGYLFLKTF